MGAIFKDVTDDQQEAMMETIYVGQTWQFRYMRIRYIFWGAVSTVTGIVGTAFADYGISKFTDYSWDHRVVARMSGEIVVGHACGRS